MSLQPYRACPKPKRHQLERQKDKASARTARAKCLNVVWTRAGSRCEWREKRQRCNKRLERGAVAWERRGEVDEWPKSRAQGADATDPKQCRLVCMKHHYDGPSGAHRVSPNWRQP